MAITSVGLTNQPIMLLQAIFQALNVGTTALVARFTGMGQPDKASDTLTLRQTFVVTILLGLIISLFAGVAAPMVGMNILSLSFMPGMAFATAATTLVGQYLGAKRPDDAERCGNTSHKMGLTVGLCMAGIFLFFGKYIAMLYTDNPDVVLVSTSILKIYSFAQPFQSTQFILAGGLRGAGDNQPQVQNRQMENRQGIT